jgi:hypothetical protein
MDPLAAAVGLSIGVVVSEIAWSIARPIVGLPQQGRMQWRAALSVAVIFGGVFAFFYFDRKQWLTNIDGQFWSDAVVAYGLPFLWLIVALFERSVIDPGLASRLRAARRGLEGTCFVGACVVTLYAALGANRGGRPGVAICAGLGGCLMIVAVIRGTRSRKQHRAQQMVK